MPPSSIRDWAARHRIELGLSLRMFAAGLLSYGVGEALGLSRVYWVVVTAIIVMQASVGGSLKASLDRVVGTIGGAAWGVAVAVAMPHQGVVATGAALAATLAPLALMAAFRPAYRVATVTGAIVLLGRFGEVGLVQAAFDRVCEIGLGSVVALAVALLIAPARAQGMLGGAGRDALRGMSDLTAALLADLAEPVDPGAVVALHDRIRAAIERAAIAAGEATRERRSLVTEAPDPAPLVRCLRRLGHDFVIVARARSARLPEPVAAQLAAPIGAMAAALSGHLTEIGIALAARAAPPESTRVSDSFESYQQVMGMLRRDGVTRDLPGEEVERVFGLSFGLEQIRRNLDDLAGHARDLARPLPV